jgi:hypothetical protein
MWPKGLAGMRTHQTVPAEPCYYGRIEGILMRFVFLAVALILFFMWIGAFVVFHVAAALIHLLLIVAVFFFLVHLFGGRRAA